jgi:BlaI family penicillinase repressor
MPRSKASDQLTPLELEIMKVLWDSGASTVQAVQTALGPERKLAYTTVQTMLNVLVRKGKAKRTLADRAYRYRAALTREKAAGNTLRDVVDRLFGGSAEALVMSLVEAKQLTPATLRRLQRLAEEDDEK